MWIELFWWQAARHNALPNTYSFQARHKKDGTLDFQIVINGTEPILVMDENYIHAVVTKKESSSID